MIVFDWDGTAVSSRQAPVDEILWRLEVLLGRGIWLAVITGTNFDNIDAQFFSKVNPRVKGRLLACVNRGSEVYGFNERGEVVRLHARVATERENALLDEVGARVQRELDERYGLATDVVRNRMNRRKLDIIPVPEWADPKKESIAELLSAVEARLRAAGIPGIRRVVDTVVAWCKEVGLDAKITTDVKHIEFGLTDKADSADYLMNYVARPNGIDPGDVLFIGDEFGPVGGFEGSDAKMAVPAAKGATYVSVGMEPNGVPEGVCHMGGGADGFIGIIDEQMRLWRAGASPFAEPPMMVHPTASNWAITETRCGSQNAASYETIFTVANGYLGTRGAHEDGLYTGKPATFVAGVFDQPPGKVTELVVAPDWLSVGLSIEGQPVSADPAKVHNYSRTLDMARGALSRTYRYSDGENRVVRVDSERFASIDDYHLVCMRYRVTMEHGTGRILLSSRLNGDVCNSGAQRVRTEETHASPDGGMMITAATLHSGHWIVMAGINRVSLLTKSGQAHLSPTAVISDGVRAGHDFEIDLAQGDSVTLEKYVAVFTSRDTTNEPTPPTPPSPLSSSCSAPLPSPAALASLAAAARNRSSRAAASGFDVCLSLHSRRWAARWAESDVRVVGPDFDQAAIRFALFHTMAAASETDERVSIAAKSLHGEGYKGHVFWDTEIFILPFFIVNFPAIARNLLMYRVHTLAGARRKALQRGYLGAMYAWESADTGDETTPTWTEPHPVTGERIRIWCGDTEDHVTADISYAVWNYYRWTGDEEFLFEHGAEIILETALFWMSRAVWNSGRDRYEYLRVIGPDEFHDNIDNNAFTNYMAKWNIEKAVDIAGRLRAHRPDRWEALSRRLRIDDTVIAEMKRISSLIYLPRPDAVTNVIEQFEGYHRLEDIDLASIDTGGLPIDVFLGHEGVSRTTLIKQADVIMLMNLLPDLYGASVWEANWSYYEPRTTHASSLSPSAHAVAACRLARPDDGYRYLQKSVALDLADRMGNNAAGIHSANLGGIWQAFVFGFAGVEPLNGGVRIRPCLPSGWDRIEAPIKYRGIPMTLAVTRERVKVAVGGRADRAGAKRSGPDHAVADHAAAADWAAADEAAPGQAAPTLLIECEGVVRQVGLGETVEFMLGA
jgi:trehalose/maltose hydrolase-like predicted phosphorylase/hydroxymethylpyrimidine pyrophosphatase-like HAD family hydrolase